MLHLNMKKQKNSNSVSRPARLPVLHMRAALWQFHDRDNASFVIVADGMFQNAFQEQVCVQYKQQETNALPLFLCFSHMSH